MDLEQNEIAGNDYVLALKDVVKSFMLKHPKLTINSLAQRANIPVSSLRRLVKDEQKVDIAPHNVLNILGYIYREKSLPQLIKLISPVLKEYLEKYFGGFILEQKTHQYSADLNVELSDQIKYFIYKLCSHQCGATRMQIVELYGALGTKKLGEMMANGLIYESEEVLHAKEKNFSLDIAVSSKHLPELVRFYKPETLDDGLNLFYSLSESLSKEAIAKVKAIQKEAVKKIYEIVIDPKEWGDIHYFSVHLCETMNISEYKNYQGVLQ